MGCFWKPDNNCYYCEESLEREFYCHVCDQQNWFQDINLNWVKRFIFWIGRGQW